MKITVTAPGATLQDEGTPLTPTRPNINFIGTAVTVTDNPGTNSTDVTITVPAAGVTAAAARTFAYFIA